MYEYGCFVSFWGNFDLMMEALIWHLHSTGPITNCREIHKLTSGAKHQRLTQLLKLVSQEAEFVSDADLNARAGRRVEHEANVRIHGTLKERPADRFKAGAAGLYAAGRETPPSPGHPVGAARACGNLRIPASADVREGAAESVPPRWKQWGVWRWM